MRRCIFPHDFILIVLVTGRFHRELIHLRDKGRVGEREREGRGEYRVRHREVNTQHTC